MLLFNRCLSTMQVLPEKHSSKAPSPKPGLTINNLHVDRLCLYEIKVCLAATETAPS